MKIKIELTIQEYSVLNDVILEYYKQNFLHNGSMLITDNIMLKCIKKLMFIHIYSISVRLHSFQHKKKYLLKTMWTYEKGMLIYFFCKFYPANTNDIYTCNLITRCLTQIEHQL
jgi:hypothetical protein